jgi:PAS domain S-box-containing protein
MLSESLHQELIDLRQRVAEQAARLTHLERQLLHFQQATPTLEAVHQKLSVLWQQSPIAIIEWNTTFEVVDWNPTAEKLLGYSKQEAMGRPVTALLTLEDSHQATSTWLHQPNGDGVRHGTITKDGRVIACDWLNTPLLNAQEQVTGIVSLVRACSEDASPPLSPLGTSVTNQAIVPSPSSPLQTAPADISSVFLSDIINATVDPLFVKDEQHRYIILNKPYCEFMGWNHADVIGLNDHEIFPDTQQADFFRDIDQAMLTSGSDREDEETLTNLDGITHIFSTKKAYLRDASGKSFIIGTMRDITALKAAEAALKQSKEELEMRVEARTVELQQTVRATSAGKS